VVQRSLLTAKKMADPTTAQLREAVNELQLESERLDSLMRDTPGDAGLQQVRKHAAKVCFVLRAPRQQWL
jgi:hypothetical protein